MHRERTVAFPLKQWLQESATLLHFTYTAHLAVTVVTISSITLAPPSCNTGLFTSTSFTKVITNFILNTADKRADNVPGSKLF
jgi:hypothetical protein